MSLVQRFTGYFANVNIKTKLMLSYFPVTMLVIAAIAFFSYQLSFDSTREQSIKIVTQAQEQISSGITSRMENYESFLNNVFFDADFLYFVKGNYSTSYEEYLMKNEIQKKIIPMLMATGKPANLAIVRYNNQLNESIPSNFNNILSSKPIPDLLEQRLQNCQVYNIERIEGKAWYRELQGRMDTYLWMQVEDDEQFNNISVMREITDFSSLTGKKIGLLKLTIRLEDILDLREISVPSKNFFYLLFDSNNRLLFADPGKEEFYRQNSETLKQYLDQLKDNDSVILKNMALVKSTIRMSGWKMLSVTPLNDLTEKARRIRDLTLFSSLIALLLIFFITYKLSSTFSNRIIAICRHMRDFQTGDFEQRIEKVHQDELGYLGKTFNEMVQKTKQLIDEVYQANIDKKEAQLKALQAQINPHFLYNSLSCINRLADLKDMESINQMVKSLAVFYRMTLNKGRDDISIADELEQVRAYLSIYKIRQGDFFHVTWKVEQETLECQIIKVILQPFVENILEHGMYRRKSPINIILSVEQSGEDILFKIIDDGIGMDREKMSGAPHFGMLTSSGYGIKNVDDRLKLHYGPQYGVTIFSRPGIGTAVSIRVPKVPDRSCLSL